MKGSLNFLRNLSGKIEYSTNVLNFWGNFKLNKDPRAEKISGENIIFRGSTLKLTDWL